MKRTDLAKHLTQAGCVLHHRGGRHDVWVNTKTLAQAPIPRHREIKHTTARVICKMLGAPKPC